MSNPSYAEQWEVDELATRIARLEFLASAGLDLLSSRQAAYGYLRDVLRECKYGKGRLKADLIKKLKQFVDSQ